MSSTSLVNKYDLATALSTMTLKSLNFVLIPLETDSGDKILLSSMLFVLFV